MPVTKPRGRPQAKEKMEQITIKLPPDMIEELRELSDKSYNPMSYYIRQTIAEYLEKNSI